jgi:hypothetical protein
MNPMEMTMHKTLIAAFAALAMLSGTASAAYAESNNLAATEVPATGVGISSGPAMTATGSEAYQVSARTVLQRSNVAVRDGGSEQYQDTTGMSVQAGHTAKTELARS